MYVYVCAYTAVGTTFQGGQSKIWKNLYLKSKSIEEQMVWISIVFTFICLNHDHVVKVSAKIFFTVKRDL